MKITKDSIFKLSIPHEETGEPTPNSFGSHACLNSLVDALPTKTDEEVLAAIEAAKEFVTNPENGALGIASNQIDYGLGQWFVMKLKRTGEVRIIWFPTVIGKQGQIQKIETCFSVPDSFKIKRAKKITVEYQSPHHDSPLIREILEGQDAQVFCHEYEHLCGKLINRGVKQ